MSDKRLLTMKLGFAILMIPVSQSYSASFRLWITNAGVMPLSPGVVYVQKSSIQNGLGTRSSTSLIQLCQTGQGDNRYQELVQTSGVSAVKKSPGPILPGKREYVDIDVKNLTGEEVTFEAMYGLTKDACTKITINSAELGALVSHKTPVIRGKDLVITTGAFLPPSAPVNDDDLSVCETAARAIDCLRLLSVKNPDVPTSRFLSPYSPTVITALEKKYGSSEVQPLLLPTSGAVEFQLTLNH